MLTKYDSYKNSEVDWLGKIPESWEVKRVKDVSTIYNGSTPKSDFESFWDGDIVWITPKDISKDNFIEESDRKITREGYLSCGTFLTPPNSIIMTTRAPIGNISITKVSSCTNQGCKTLVPKKIEYKFLFYMLKSQNLRLQSLGSGTTFFELSTSELKGFLFQKPKQTEQNKISNFLVKKTSQIDKKIKFIQDKKSNYEELKKSLINEAVCSGINKDVVLKDSGIEWIGKIPKHWKVERLKNIFKIEKEVVGNKSTEYKLLSLTQKGVIPRDINEGFGKFPAEFNTYQVVKPNDLIFCLFDMDVTPRTIGISSYFGMITGAYTIVKSIKNVFNKYYYYLFLMADKDKKLSLYYTGLRNTIRKEKFFTLSIPFLSDSEQIQIANYLDEKTSKIDKIVSKINDQIETLKEFRKTLINDIVTGKVRVQDE